MDPDANLNEQLELAQEIVDSEDTGFNHHEQAWRLAELVLALHEWMCRGGFSPEPWQVTKVEGKEPKR
jgi:hypothetical protein